MPIRRVRIRRYVARMAARLSRLPDRVPALTVNRLCASGLDAAIAGAAALRHMGWTR